MTAASDLRIVPSALAPDIGLGAAMYQVSGRGHGMTRVVHRCAGAVHALVRAALLAADIADDVGEYCLPPVAPAYATADHVNRMLPMRSTELAAAADAAA